MNTQTITTQSPDTNASRESTVRRLRVNRRSAPAPDAVSADRTEARRQAGGARILRRWSVADLIASAGGAPRAFA
jgi:hypothetical protein